MSNQAKSRPSKPKNKQRPAQTAEASHSSAPAGHSASAQPPMQDALLKRKEKRSARAAERAEQLERLKKEGNTLFKDGDYEGAVSIYIEAIDTFGPKPVLYSNLAAAHLKLEEYELAEQAAFSALVHDPRMFKARYRRGLARKGMFHLKGAVTDFETVIAQDPSCLEAREQLEIVRALLSEFGESSDSEEGSDIFGDDFPPYQDQPLSDSEPESDSSDCRHTGNGFACRFYNHGGCSRGIDCDYSHAPDDRSERDQLGRNVCLFFLLGMCKFGESKCVYSHDKTYLPPGNWWSDEEAVAKMREIYIATSKDPSRVEAIDKIRDDIFKTGKRPRPRGAYLGGQRGLSDRVRSDAKKKASPAAEDPARFVMILALDGDLVEAYKSPTLATLKAKLPYKKAMSANEALAHLASPNLAGVFVADAGITKSNNSKVLRKLVEWVKTGGSVVIGGSFSSFVRPSDMNSFFDNAWGVPWKAGSYYRSNFSINASHAVAKQNPSLPSSYSMKALHVKDISPAVAIYTATSDFQKQNLVLPPQPITDFSESPAVQTSIGKGSMGYIGDVNWESGSAQLVLAMLGLLDPPKAAQPNPAPASTSSQTKTIPRSNPTPASKPSKQPTAPAKASRSKPKSPDSFVMLLSLENEEFFASIHAHFLSALRSKIEWKQAFTAPSALVMLASPDLVSVFVTDPGIVKQKNAQVLAKLVQYVKDGGSVVVGGLFSTFVPGLEMDKFFERAWGLSWKGGSYHRTTFSRNADHEMVKKNPSLESSYSMKALHVGGISAGDAVYLPADDARLQSMVFGPALITDHSESPVVQRRIGSGWFGYIGDVNAEKASTGVILAMLGLLDSPNDSDTIPVTTPLPPAAPTPVPAASPSPAPISSRAPAPATSSAPEPTKTAPGQPSSRPFIMILSFGMENLFSTSQSALLSTLKNKLEVLHGLSNERVIDLLGSRDLVGIFITYAAIADVENSYLLSKLIAYAKAGGKVVLGGAFSGFITPGDMKPFFQKWGFPWDCGDYTNVDIKANAKHELVKKYGTALPGPSMMKALHLSGVTLDNAVYLRERRSTTSMQAPVVYAKVGTGRLGYIGDVGLQDDHSKIVLAMLGILN